MLMVVWRVWLPLILALSLLAGAAVQAETQTGPRLEKAEIPGITYFTRMTGSSGVAGDLVGFGGTTAPSAIAELKAAGFGTIINLRLSAERGAEVEASRAAAEAAGMNYVHLPFNPAASTEGIVDQFLAAVSAAGNQPAYIHCSSATRVAALWMVMRVEADDWTVEAAGEEARSIAGRPARAVELGASLIESQPD
jgi:uncharacterized protein (TIGR01244 family)